MPCRINDNRIVVFLQW